MTIKYAIFNILVSLLFLFLNTACTLSDATEVTQPTAPVLEELASPSPTMMPTEIALSLPTLPPSDPTVTPESTAIVPEIVEQTIEIPNLADATVYLHPNSTFSNFGDSEELTLGADSDGNPYYILLNFELSGFIPANATIKEANLNITASDTVFWGFPFAIFPIEEEWEEGTVMGENLPSYNQELSIQFDLDESNPSMSFPITEIVQGWVDGTIDAHGVLLSANVIQNTAKFHSVEGMPAYRPTLEIIYEVPVIPIVTSFPTESTPAQNLTMSEMFTSENAITQIGGTTYSIAFQGDYAFIGVGPRLVALDISNPATPIELGKSPSLGKSVLGIQIANNYAYVGTATDLHVLNIANPSEPNVITSLKISAYDLVIREGILFVAGRNLLAFDLADPEMPTLIGEAVTPSFVNDFIVVDNFAYVIGGRGGLRIFDVTNPTIPTEVAAIEDFDAGRMMTIQDDHIYITARQSGGVNDALYTVNVSDPLHPFVSSTIEIVTSSGPMPTHSFASRSMAVDEQGFLYVGGEATYDLRVGVLVIMNTSNPASPFKVNEYLTDGIAYNINIRLNHAYLSNSVGFEVINIGNPFSVAHVSSYFSGWRAGQLLISDNYVYVGSSGFKVIDISDPTQPEWIGSYLDDTTIRDMEKFGNLLIVSAGGSNQLDQVETGGLFIFDASDPANLVMLNFYDVPGEDFNHEIVVFDEHLYFVESVNTFTILDLSDTINPLPIGSFTSSGQIAHMTIDDYKAYVVDIAFRDSTEPKVLRVIDVTNLANPVQVGIYEPSREPVSVLVSGHYAYLLTWDSNQRIGGVEILDISDPENILLVGFFDSKNQPVGIIKEKEYLYLRIRGAFASANLMVVDVSNPRTPQLILWDEVKDVVSVLVRDGYLYSAEGNAGLFIYRWPFP